MYSETSIRLCRNYWENERCAGHRNSTMNPTKRNTREWQVEVSSYSFWGQKGSLVCNDPKRFVNYTEVNFELWKRATLFSWSVTISNTSQITILLWTCSISLIVTFETANRLVYIYDTPQKNFYTPPDANSVVLLGNRNIATEQLPRAADLVATFADRGSCMESAIDS